MSAPVAASAPPACSLCNQPVQAYFLLSGRIFCEACRGRVEQAILPTVPLPQALFGATALGLGAAIIGAAAWALIVFAAHIQLGILAIGIGWLVGTGVRRGAQKHRGGVFSAIALTLTACAIVWSLVPLLMQGASAAAERTGHPLDPVMIAWLLTAGPFIAYERWVETDPLTLLFLGIALYQAWRLTMKIKLPFTGPHHVAGGIDFSRP